LVYPKFPTKFYNFCPLSTKLLTLHQYGKEYFVDFGDLHEHYWNTRCASLRVLRGLMGGGQIETFLENNFFEVFRKNV
jgi:hypothetical protein